MRGRIILFLRNLVLSKNTHAHGRTGLGAGRASAPPPLDSDCQFCRTKIGQDPSSNAKKEKTNFNMFVSLGDKKSSGHVRERFRKQ